MSDDTWVFGTVVGSLAVKAMVIDPWRRKAIVLTGVDEGRVITLAAIMWHEVVDPAVWKPIAWDVLGMYGKPPKIRGLATS